MSTPKTEARSFEPLPSQRRILPPDAFSSLPALEAEKALRAMAIGADALASGELALAELWQELARGRSRIACEFFSEQRCYLLVTSVEAGQAVPIEGRRLDILRAVLKGLRQKNIAIDLGLAPSTVALNSRLALQNLGVTCRPSRAHPLLMKAAVATAGDIATCSTMLNLDGRELRVVAMPRPDRNLGRLLPTAELAVIRNLVEGLSYEDIARQRGTSTRTIANQITAVFRRLRVSGRNELVQRLFMEEPSAAAPGHETLIPPGVTASDHPEGWHGARRSA